MDKILYYLKQPSTLRGLVSIFVGIGLFSFSPEAQDKVVETIILIIATGESIKGIINVMRDEKKQQVTNVLIQKINEPQSSADTINQLQSGKF